jgi:replicative DNA helicase
MSDMALMQRIISAESKISSEKIRTGMLRTSDFQSIMNAAGRIYDAPLYIVDSPNMKLLDLRAQARRMKMQQDIKIIFIDYITLVSSENPDLPRYEQVAEISRSLKSLARELDIPVIALSQVRRETEGKRPTLADIRESGSIEQDADVVLFLHREREGSGDHKDNDGRLAPIPTELIIAKQRNGPVGTVNILFQPSFTKFVSLTKDNQQ